LIQLIELTKRFGQLVAVNRIDLHVKQGEIFGFLGPNGAGKTTTIKMLAGLLKPTSGRALIDGYDVVAHPVEAKRVIGFIPFGSNPTMGSSTMMTFGLCRRAADITRRCLMPWE